MKPNLNRLGMNDSHNKGSLLEGKEVSWTVHLAKREPFKTSIVFLFACLAGVLGAMLLNSILGFPFGFLVILVSTADFLLPVKHGVNRDGAWRKCGLSWSEIAWKDVKRVVAGDEGIKLSPLERSTRLAPFRGVFLRFGNNKQEILEAVEYWRNKYASDVGKASG